MEKKHRAKDNCELFTRVSEWLIVRVIWRCTIPWIYLFKGAPATGADAHPGPPGPWPGVRPKFFSFCSRFYLWIWINCWRRSWINCWRRINILLRDGAFYMLSVFPFIFSCIFWTMSLWTSILKTRPEVRLNPGSATAHTSSCGSTFSIFFKSKSYALSW